MARNTNIKLRRSATAGAKPTTSNLDLGELALNTYDGKLYAKTTEGSASEVIQIGSATDSYHKIRKSQTLTFTVTVAAKTTDHTWYNSGSSSGYYINGLQSPHLHLVPGNKYRFDQSDSSNSGHPLRFYYEADKTTIYTTGVTTSGTAGSSGAYTEITVSDTTPMLLHYQCSAHAYMGGRADFATRNFTGFDTNDLTEGSTNLYYTTARANSDFDTRFATKTTSNLTEGSNLYYTTTRANTDFDTRLASKTTDNLTEGSSNLYHTTNRVRSALSAGTGISYNSSTGVITNTITQYADSDTRLAISVTDAGGDGSLTYNNSNGVITYTGPSASEVRAHFSAGTGVSISSGQISIGQAVATSSNVQFNNVQVDGTLTSDDITSTNISVAGNATITGNLTVQGTTTTVNSNTVNIGDNIIVLNSDETGTPSQNAGIEIERGTSSNVYVTFNESQDRWKFTNDGSTYYNLATSTSDIAEGTNLYYTDARADARIAAATTDDLSEGSSNLYFTNARADARIAAASIGDLSNVDITTNAPSSGQILKWNGTNFVPSADLSGASASNSFETISVSGQSNVVADSSTDTLTLIAGTGMSISTNATNDEITFTSTATGTVTEAFKNVAVSGQSNIVADAAADTLTFAAGSGISLTTDASTDTLTITSTATGSVTEAFKTIAVSGQSNVVADSATDTLTLVAGSGMTISTNATSDEITFASSGGGGSQSGVFTEFTFTATSNQTTFTGSDDNSATLSYNASAVQVFLNGVLQENGTDYTATNGSSVVLVNAANSGDILQVSAYTQVLGFGDSALSELTGDGTTIAFTIAANPNNENNTQVYIDGVYQEKGTYSVSGTTLTFSSAPPNGTSIEVVIGSRNVSVDDVSGLTVAADLTLSGLSAQNSEATSLMINGSNIVGTRELGSNAFTSNLSSYNTDNLTEGSSNLYYTNARADARIAAATTDDLTEGSSNLYFTNARVDSRLASGSLATISTSGNVTVGGNLTVSGTTTTLNTATLDVEDKNITLNYGSGDTSSSADGAGITIQDAVSSSTDATILWDASDDEFDFSHAINIPNLKVSGAQGTDGQLLTSTGSGIAWEDAPASGPTFKTFGTSSIMVGDSTTGTINAANYNVGLGVDVFENITTADSNTAIGFEAGKSITNQGDNVFVGSKAGKSNNTYQSTYIGAQAGENVVGNRGVGIGYLAMQDNIGSTTGDIGIGFLALQYKNTTDGGSVAIGQHAMRGVSNDKATGKYNVAIGQYAMQYYTSAAQNVAIGKNTLSATTTGAANVAIGHEALKANTTASNNTAVGYRAGELITTGSYNVVIGSYDGNEGGLDIRTSSNNIILSDGSGNIRMRIDSSGKVGIGTVSPGVSLDVGSLTDAIRVPNGTTGQRPTAALGQLRYNTTTSEFEGYAAGAWGKIGGGGDSFGTIAVSGQSNVVAEQENDTLTLVGTNGVSITTNASSDTVTIDGRTSYSPFTTDLFTTSNNSTTAFVLSKTPSSEDNLIVFLEGVYQNKNSYTLSGSTLTLDAAPASGEEVVVHIAGDVITGEALTRNNFTGNGSTTAFTLTLAPMNENNCYVYSDGVYQEKSEFSVSGTTLTFGSAPANGASLEVLIPKATQINTPADDSISSIDMFDDTAIIGSALTSTTVASTSATTIATHAAATYRTIKYLVQCTQGTDYHSTEINLIHDGSTVYITEYGTLFDNASLGTFNATISSGNILLQITPGSATSMAVKVVSSAIPV